MTFIWNVVKTIVWLVIICAVWEWLEVSIYGVVQPRVVDEIMLLLFIPFIYMATATDSKKQKGRNFQGLSRKEDAI